jgi:MFS family permease
VRKDHKGAVGQGAPTATVPTADDQRTVAGVPLGVIVLGIARMADGFGNSFLIVVLPLYIDSGRVGGELLGLGPAAISGLVLGLFGLVLSLAQPFTGRLSDRLGRRQPLILLGLLVLAVANVSFSLVSTYVGVLGARFAQGVGAALTITASVALVNELSTRGTRGGNMGVYNSFRLLGFGGGPLVAGVVVSAGPYVVAGVALSGFEAAFVIAGIAAALSAVAVLAFVRDTPWTRPNRRGVALRIRGDGQALDATFVLGVATLVMAASIALLATIEPVVNERLRQGPISFSFQFAALIAALAVLQPVTGRWSDRLGRTAFVFWGLVALVPVTLVQGFVTMSWQLIAARLAQGAAAAAVFAPALALAGELAGEGESASKLSVLTMSFALGLALGQFSSGFLVGFGYAVPFAFGAALAAVGALLVHTQVRDA